MEIELKHLAPYLPYGLNVEPIYKSVQHFRGYMRKELDIDMLYECQLEDINPILRPLSDLTKEIEVNGEKFVPIVEIGKTFGFDNLERVELDNDIVEYGFTEHYQDDCQPYSFEHYKNGTFGLWYDSKDDSRPINTYCELSVIDKLFEWHFDVFGLIGSGLAIDINTLK